MAGKQALLRIDTVLARLAAAAVFVAVSGAAAAEPLHERIDKLIEAGQPSPPGPLAADAEFARRLHLDLTGRTPSAVEVRAFLDDKAEAKRAALIDRLLASPEFARHMTDRFDVVLMERRPDKNVKTDEWRKFLFDSMLAGKPYDQLAREILSADSTDPKQRPAAKFFLDREAQPDLMTRDVGRMFFGRDMQCAQCHNHPLIDDYLQADYYGLFACVSRTFLFAAKDKPVELAEKAEGDVNFQSVFTKIKGNSGPRLPEGEPLAEPVLAKGEEYAVKPANNVRPVPKHSRRALLAAEASSGRSRPFNRNIANRLWAQMMGRGLFDPVDLYHSDNPPTHPELLELVTDELVALKFDMRALLREIALSRAYQRSIDVPGDVPQRAAQAAGQLAAAEVEAQKLAQAQEQAGEAVKKLDADVQAARAPVDQAAAELAKAQSAAEAAKKAADAANAAVASATSALATKQAAAAAVAEAAAKALEAVKKLPDDKELAQAADKFKTRGEQLAGEVAALTQKTPESQAAAKSAGGAASAAAQASTAAGTVLDSARQKLAAAAKALADGSSKLRANKVAASVAAAKRDELKLLGDYQARLAAIAAMQSAKQKAAADLASAKQAEQVAMATRAAAETAQQTAQQAAAGATTAAAEADKQAAAAKSTVDVLAEAVAKADAARQKLATDTELAAVVETLKGKAAAASEQLKPLAEQAAQKQAGAKQAANAAAAARAALDAAAAKLAAAQQQLQAGAEAIKQTEQKLAAEQAAADAATKELADRWSRRGALATLKSLSPEQLAWSSMQAAGLVDQQRAAAEAEWTKANPPDPNKNPADVAVAKARFVEQFIYEKLKGNVPQFVSMYAAAAGQPQQTFFATVDQALFLANAGTLRSWLAPSGGNLTDRLLKLAEPAPLADELYVSVLSRRPSEVEAAMVAQYLAARPSDRPAAVQEIAWALLTSAEFRFNH